MRIKAKMLLPRKEVDALGNEIDPRQELVDKILEYKKYKEAAAAMAEMEAGRLLLIKRGNIQRELSHIGEEASEGTEVQTITMFKLMKAFERVMLRYQDRFNRPVHTVVRYNYSMEQSKTDMISMAQSERTLSFEKVFEKVENRVHAIFMFHSMLELVQGKFLRILIGEGKNNFIVEYNETEEGLTDEEHMRLI
jgi:segregation and condensation protein A